MESLPKTMVMKQCADFYLRDGTVKGWIVQLYEPYHQKEVQAFQDGTMEGQFTFWERKFSAEFLKAFVESDYRKMPQIPEVSVDQIFYIRNIRYDSLVTVDIGGTDSQLTRLIDDVFIFRTNEECCIIRCGRQYSSAEVTMYLEEVITALRHEGTLRGKNLNVVWLAPQNKQRQWVNHVIRAAVEDLFNRKQINYRSSHYELAEPEDDWMSVIKLRTIDLVQPRDEQGYPWILKGSHDKKSNLVRLTYWNGGAAPAVQPQFQEVPDPTGLLYTGPIATPAIAHGVPIPNPRLPGLPLPGEFTATYPTHFRPQ